MKMFFLVNVIAVSVLVSCAPSRVTPIDNMESKFVEQFRKENAAFAVERLPDDLRKPVVIKRLSRHQTLLTSGGVKLQLDLGDRWSVATNSIFRTESRYRLLDANGRTVAAAESTLAAADLNNESKDPIKVLADDSSMALFIAEEQSWATQRYILILPVQDSDASVGVAPKAWDVRYVRIPARATEGDVYAQPEFLGIKCGCLYFSMDDRNYAVPFERLDRETSLEFSIG